MNDTPKHIQQKQLEIWLAKTPAERLRQAITDNDTLFKSWDIAQQQIKKYQTKTVTTANGSITTII